MGFSLSPNQGRTSFLADGSRVGHVSMIVSFACSFWLSQQNGQAWEAFVFRAPSEGSTTAVFGDTSSFSLFSQVSARRALLRAFLTFSVCEMVPGVLDLLFKLWQFNL